MTGTLQANKWKPAAPTKTGAQKSLLGVRNTQAAQQASQPTQATAPPIAAPQKSLGRRIGYQIAHPVIQMVRDNHEAVDQFLRGAEDYKKMSRWERFKWTIQNPIARTMVAVQPERQNKKMIERETTQKIRDHIAQSVFADAGGYGENYQSSKYTPTDSVQTGTSGTQTNNTSGGEEEKSEALEITKEVAGTSADVVESMFGTTDDTIEKVDNAKKIVSAIRTKSMNPFKDEDESVGSSMSATERGLNGYSIASAGVGVALDVKDIVSGAMDTHEARKQGDTRGMVSGIGGVIGAGASLAGHAADMTKGIARVAGSTGVTSVAGTVSGGIGAAGAVIEGAMGAYQFGTAAKQKAQLHGLKKNNAFGEGTRMQHAIGQASDQASIDMIAGSTKVAGAVLQGAGAAASLSGVGAAPGIVCGAVGAGIDLAGKGITAHKTHQMRHKVVNQATDYEQRMTALKQAFAQSGMEVSEHACKVTVLRSMGVLSGKRDEAFLRETSERAKEIQKFINQKNLPTEQEANRKQIVSALGLRRRKDGTYSLEAIQKRLGVEEGNALEQADALAESANGNPFKEQAERHQKKKADKKAKAAQKAQAKKSQSTAKVQSALQKTDKELVKAAQKPKIASPKKKKT